MSSQKYLLVIGGPTASGKTALAIRLARQYQTVILSADSRQFYREMSIGTAKPTPEELAEAPHHFIDSHSIEQEYSVGDYEREALALLHQCFAKHDVVILVGGSGLYIQAICEGFDEFPKIAQHHREELQTLFKSEGIIALQNELAEKDPAYYAIVDQQNPQRLIRALEVCRATGKSFSQYRQRQKKERFFQSIYLFPHWPREELYRRIDLRVDLMVEAGLVEEARRLYPYRQHNALQTVGYRELFAHFDGEHDLATAIELIKRNTRRFAKRQLTWNRRLGYGKHFPAASFSWLDIYLDLVKKEQKQLYWQKGEKQGQSSISWRGKAAAAALLKTEVYKKEVVVRLQQADLLAPEPSLQYLFLHELSCRFPDQGLHFELPAAWEATVSQFQN